LSPSVETYPRSPTGGSRELAATGRATAPAYWGKVYKGSQFLAIGVQVLVEWVDAANRLAGEQFIWAFGDIAPGG
jgi:hypothetical protein